ncbi:MAG: hypothetical protein GWP59_05080 [Chlamydiales bacterium]|nr:hypothetical protein [Chlamydiales bacterium]
MENKDSFFQELIQKKTWSIKEDQVVLASNLSLTRNVDGYAFPAKLNEEKRLQVLEVLKATATSQPSLDNHTFFLANDLDPIDKEFLFEHFFCMEAFQQAHKGEGFILDRTGLFLGLLNVKDHMQLQYITYDNDLESSWSKLLKLEEGFSKQLKFTFNQKFGYLTSNVRQSGTGLSCTSYAHVPALILTSGLNKFLSTNRSNFVTVNSLLGKEQEFLGDTLVLSNSYKTGLSEEDIIGELQRFIIKLEIAERSAQKSILDELNTELIDKVAKAYGLLRYCHTLSVLEALNSLSILKLALKLGWLKGVSEQELIKWMLFCKKGHLLINQKNEESTSEVVRAKWIKEKLSNSLLTLPN